MPGARQDGPDHRALVTEPEYAHGGRRGEAGHGIGQPQLAVGEPEGITAQHVELAVGEVDETHHAEHEGKPRRYHGIERAQREAVDDLLEEVVHARYGWMRIFSKILS